MSTTNKNKGGRPTVMTTEAVAKLKEALKLDVTVEEACSYAGISKDTYYRNLKQDKGFSDEMESFRMFASMLARKTVIREIENDGALALKYLERKRKAEFSPRSEHYVDSPDLKELILAHTSAGNRVDWDKGGLVDDAGATKRLPRGVPGSELRSDLVSKDYRLRPIKNPYDPKN